MPFTEYIFDKEEIKALVATRAENLKKNRGLSDLLSFGTGVVNDRIGEDRLRYRDYGPYWFALKDVLRRKGYDFGSQSDPLIVEAYRGDNDVETLIMADEFRTEYMATTIIYSNQFMLDGDSGEFWTLQDSDMDHGS